MLVRHIPQVVILVVVVVVVVACLTKCLESLHVYTGWLKKVSCIPCWIFQQSRNVLKKFFHCYTQQEITIKR